MKIALGTVQFGKNYGVSNQSGQPSKETVAKIIDFAVSNAIPFLDTAPLYESEEIVGNILSTHAHNFKIITKTLPIRKNIIDLQDIQKIKNTFFQSLNKLQQPNVDGVLFHHAQDLLAQGGELLYEVMLDLKSKGLLNKIGVSVYTEKETEQLLAKYALDIIQLPVNVFDQRFLKNGYLREFKKANVEIHARSVFLQGLLLMSGESIPGYFAPIRNHFNRYHQFLTQQELPTLNAALGFAFGIPEIDYIICGVNQVKELAEIVAIKKPLSSELFASFQLKDERYWNPSQWKL